MAIIAKYDKGHLPTPEEVTNLYLYGQKEKPTDMLDPTSWGINKPGFDGKVEVQIDYATFSNDILRFFNAASFEIIRIFMGLEAIYKKYLGTGGNTNFQSYGAYQKEYESKSDLMPSNKTMEQAKNGDVIASFTKYNLKEMYDLSFYGLNFNQLAYGTEDQDHAERTYIWGTQQLMINPEARFIIRKDENGNIVREIENFSIVHQGLKTVKDENDEKKALILTLDEGNVVFEAGKDENFDFKGGDNSNIGNAALEPIIDPSGIGHTVHFKFVGLPPVTDKINGDEFYKLYEDRSIADDSIPNKYILLGKMQGIVNNMFANGNAL